jgi:hypothetical protein
MSVISMLPAWFNITAMAFVWDMTFVPEGVENHMTQA